MKINAVILPKKSDKDNSYENDKSIYISFIFILCGLICGALIYLFTGANLKGSIWNLFTGFFTDFSNKSNPEIISGLILSGLPYYFAMIVFGSSIFGYPFVLLLSFIKSMAPSLLFSYLYSSYGLQGAEYVFLVMAPGKIIMLLGVLMLTQSCLTMSASLQKLTNEGSKDCKHELRKFVLRSVIIYVVLLASDLVSFITITGFSSLFSF